MLVNAEVQTDIEIIATLAYCLDAQYDNDLKSFYPSIKDLDVFKEQVLIGIYLVKWFKYNTLVNSYIYKSLIDLFREHLEISALDYMNETYFSLCLQSLSKYCSYIYFNEYKGFNAQLKKIIDKSIQLDIDKTRKMSFTHSTTKFPSSTIEHDLIYSSGII